MFSRIDHQGRPMVHLQAVIVVIDGPNRLTQGIENVVPGPGKFLAGEHRARHGATRHPDRVLYRPGSKQGLPDMVTSPRPPARHYQEIARSFQGQSPSLLRVAEVIAHQKTDPESLPVKGNVPVSRRPELPFPVGVKKVNLVVGGNQVATEPCGQSVSAPFRDRAENTKNLRKRPGSRGEHLPSLRGIDLTAIPRQAQFGKDCDRRTVHGRPADLFLDPFEIGFNIETHPSGEKDPHGPIIHEPGAHEIVDNGSMKLNPIVVLVFGLILAVSTPAATAQPPDAHRKLEELGSAMQGATASTRRRILEDFRRDLDGTVVRFTGAVWTLSSIDFDPAKVDGPDIKSVLFSWEYQGIMVKDDQPSDASSQQAISRLGGVKRATLIIIRSGKFQLYALTAAPRVIDGLRTGASITLEAQITGLRDDSLIGFVTTILTTEVNTRCPNDHQLPAGHDFKFCPYCGEPLK